MTVGKRDCASPLMRRKAACRLNAHRSFFMTVGMTHLGLMLSRLALMVQAAFLDGQFLDHFSPFDDGCVAGIVRAKRLEPECGIP